MVIGFCGSGSMAAAMARGWVGAVDTMLFTDGGSGRAAELAAEVGGRAAASNAELAEAADVIVLAVKPARLGDAAAEIGELRSRSSPCSAPPRWRASAPPSRAPTSSG